jgi:hypothetical protein
VKLRAKRRIAVVSYKFEARNSKSETSTNVQNTNVQNPIDCHCERSPAPDGVQGEVKQSHEIATPACRNACLHEALWRREALRRAGTSLRSSQWQPYSVGFWICFEFRDSDFGFSVHRQITVAPEYCLGPRSPKVLQGRMMSAKFFHRLASRASIPAPD